METALTGGGAVGAGALTPLVVPIVGGATPPRTTAGRVVARAGAADAARALTDDGGRAAVAAYAAAVEALARAELVPEAIDERAALAALDGDDSAPLACPAGTALAALPAPPAPPAPPSALFLPRAGTAAGGRWVHAARGCGGALERLGPWVGPSGWRGEPALGPVLRQSARLHATLLRLHSGEVEEAEEADGLGAAGDTRPGGRAGGASASASARGRAAFGASRRGGRPWGAAAVERLVALLPEETPEPDALGPLAAELSGYARAVAALGAATEGGAAVEPRSAAALGLACARAAGIVAAAAAEPDHRWGVDDDLRRAVAAVAREHLRLCGALLDPERAGALGGGLGPAAAGGMAELTPAPRRATDLLVASRAAARLLLADPWLRPASPDRTARQMAPDPEASLRVHRAALALLSAVRHALAASVAAGALPAAGAAAPGSTTERSRAVTAAHVAIAALLANAPNASDTPPAGEGGSGSGASGWTRERAAVALALGAVLARGLGERPDDASAVRAASILRARLRAVAATLSPARH